LIIGEQVIAGGSPPEESPGTIRITVVGNSHRPSLRARESATEKIPPVGSPAGKGEMVR